MNIAEYTRGYEVKSHRSLGSGAMEANIYRDGKMIIHVENAGRGGCNLYQPVRDNDNFAQELADFNSFASDYFTGDAPDVLVETLINVKRAAAFAKKHNQPFGSVANDLIDQLREEATSWGHPAMCDGEIRFVTNVAAGVKEDLGH